MHPGQRSRPIGWHALPGSWFFLAPLSNQTVPERLGARLEAHEPSHSVYLVRQYSSATSVNGNQPWMGTAPPKGTAQRDQSSRVSATPVTFVCYRHVPVAWIVALDNIPVSSDLPGALPLVERRVCVGRAGRTQRVDAVELLAPSGSCRSSALQASLESIPPGIGSVRESTGLV
ncbi:hypothetical protein PDE_05005 [Penicillium oxalicum 114-2]|uniref:Uncharacterized protein n=1 Tax=Penicillium oxalicum (strain 114-2 / CGMCC 5302) TaxID=933388 RepID=S7ZHA9_PENO1|nr:hypothetical protein PDE_05005 [Penicillium oxalicum 114-2]